MNSRKKSIDPKWLKGAMEVLDRFERRHSSIAHLKFTQENIAKESGVSRMTVSTALREEEKGGNAAFRKRYAEVTKNLATLGDKPLYVKIRARQNKSQRIRSLEKKNEELEKQMSMSALRWMSVLRLAEREGWKDFELKLAELINPRDPRLADRIQRPEE